MLHAMLVQIMAAQAKGAVLEGSRMMQDLVQPPQKRGSVIVLAQNMVLLEVQIILPIGQVHAPAVHTAFGPHALPQAPQFFASVMVLVQALAHTTCPIGQAPHTPELHLAPSAHALPHIPQLAGSAERSAQPLLHAT